MPFGKLAKYVAGTVSSEYFSVYLVMLGRQMGEGRDRLSLFSKARTLVVCVSMAA